MPTSFVAWKYCTMLLHFCQEVTLLVCIRQLGRSICGEVIMQFAEWLQQELDKRNWDQAEFSRRSGVTRGQISRIIAGIRGAGPDVCIAIARGLNLPREEVFKARGWLLSEPENPFGPEIDPRVKKLAKKINALPFNSREITLDAMEAVLQTSSQFSNKIQQLSANGECA